MGRKAKEAKKGEETGSLTSLFNATPKDPALEALFSLKNAGPLLPLKPVRVIPEPVIEQEPAEEGQLERIGPAEEAAKPEKKSKKRKRKSVDEESKVDDIESRYLKKVYSKAAKSTERQPKPIPKPAPSTQDEDPAETDDEQPAEAALDENDDKDLDENDDNKVNEDSADEEDPSTLLHESLAPESAPIDKTLFLSNLPIKVLTSKPDLRSLRSLLTEHGALTSLRFRSLAFSAPTPRRVSFIHKAFHPDRDSANAYAVYRDAESVARAVAGLNGVLWEGKHLRADAAVGGARDYKRCVFVGNLPFEVHDEALWGHFERCGEIEFVRVVRDQKTNLGKGFGYVQFKERESVEKAVMLNEKPSATIKRNLRVTYAKSEFRQPKQANRTSGAALRLKRKEQIHTQKGSKDKVVLEGKRATKDKSGGSGFKIGKKRGKMRVVEKPRGRKS